MTMHHLVVGTYGQPCVHVEIVTDAKGFTLNDFSRLLGQCKDIRNFVDSQRCIVHGLVDTFGDVYAKLTMWMNETEKFSFVHEVQ